MNFNVKGQGQGHMVFCLFLVWMMLL